MQPPADRTIRTNGIELHVTEQGAGPPVVLLHGFPELGYSWRHQLPALAAAGFHAVAPDLRGFGRSSRPAEVDAYDVLTLADDVAGLLDALDAPEAVIVGHDWGANLAWWFALAHPGRTRAVAGLSVPFIPRPPMAPLPVLRERLGDAFYFVWFQEPGVADAALARDVRRTLATAAVWDAEWAQRDDDPPTPPWASEEELAVYVREFTRTGFTGGLNWYRNLDRNWERTEHLATRRIAAPALFLTGDRDPVRRFVPHQAMDGWVTDLRDKVFVAGAGHFVQQERPGEVNAALLGFLASLEQA